MIQSLSDLGSWQSKELRQAGAPQSMQSYPLPSVMAILVCQHVVHSPRDRRAPAGQLAFLAAPNYPRNEPDRNHGPRPDDGQPLRSRRVDRRQQLP